MKTWFILLLISLGKIGFAHEGHGIPGALPPAPHGGVVQEASHGGENRHFDEKEEKEETELFFEVTYKNNELSIYPLVLPAGKTNAFVPISARSALSKVDLKAEFPRAKKFEPLVAKIENDSIKAAFDSKGANRFIVHIGTEFEKEMKTSKVQIERK